MAFTIGEYLEFAKTEDLMAMVIRGHHFVVDSLDEIIENGFADKKVVKRLVGTEVQNRADLALLGGLITPAEHSMILRLNGLRNRAAHRKGYKVSTDDERLIYESLRLHKTYLGNVAAAKYSGSRFPETLRFCILVITILLSVRADKIKKIGPRTPVAETVLGQNLIEDWVGKDTLAMFNELIKGINRWATALSISLKDVALPVTPALPQQSLGDDEQKNDA